MDKELLYKFFRGTSTVEEEKKLMSWLESDPANEKTFIDERALYNSLLMADEDGIKTASGRLRWGLPRWGRELLRTAAVVALTIAAAGYFYARLSQKVDDAANSIAVPVGQYLTVILSDGTKVVVNGSSEITYPAVFTGKNRTVRLSGEAFFEVAHDASHPFIVETDDCDIEVLGTSFNVEAYDNDREFVVSLVEGSVKVTNNNRQGESVILTPSQEARLREDRLVVGAIPEHEKFQWRDGLIVFRNASFGELMILFEKYYGFDIIYNEQLLPAGTFTGKIRISEGIDHGFWVLRQNASFTYSKDNDTQIIHIN